MQRTIEFLVKGIVEGVSGRLRVIGRCTEDEIRVGDVLGQLYHIDRSSEAERPPRLDEQVIELRVCGIHAYGHSLDYLSTGMTGSLDLEGAGQGLVAPGCLIGSVPVAVPLNTPSVQDAAHYSKPA